MVLKLLCLLKLHNWGNWQYESPERCTQVQVCNRCGRKRHGEQKAHNWGEWRYVNSCIQVQICNRCGQESHQEEHDWELIESKETGSSDHVSPGSYYDTHRLHTVTTYWENTLQCKKCGMKKTEHGASTDEWED